MTRVSVLLPFRNEARWLPDALRSIRRQTFAGFQAILVDDGSTDGSRDVALRICSEDPRFMLMDPPCPGLVNSLNAGLHAAAGEWIARFDADDVCHPERLALQLDMASRMGPRCVVSCLVRCFPLVSLSPGYRRYQDWMNSLVTHEEITRDIFVESPIPHPGAFYNREAVTGAGGYRDMGLPEDYELWLRLWARGFSFGKVPRHLLAWRERPDRYSRTSPSYSLTAFYRTKAMYLAGVPCLRGGRVVVAGSGQTARRLSKWMLAEGFEILAFVGTGPVPEGGTLRGIQVVGPERMGEFRGFPVVGASREPGARSRIRAFLAENGLVEGTDFVMCS